MPAHRPPLRDLALLAGCQLLVLGVLWAWDGTHADKEALKYLGCARQVLQGDLHDLFGNYRHYGVYVLFLAPFVALGQPLWAIPAQAALAFVAALALGRTVRRLGGGDRAGFMATCVLLVAVPVQQWVLALYTESLCASLTLLLLDQVLGRERPGRLAVPFALLLLFTRPVGLLIAGPLAIAWYARHQAWWIQGFGHVAVLAAAVLTPTVAEPQLRIIVGSDVLCGCTDHVGIANSFTGHSVLDTQLHLAQALGPGELVRLWGLRLLSLFTFTRPHYSVAHNLLMAPWLLLYPLALAGLWRNRTAGWPGALLGMVTVYALLVMLTCDEWSGRFLVPLVGPLLIPAFLVRSPTARPE